MSEVTARLNDLLEKQSPKTFEGWVDSFSEEDRDAINDSLTIAYERRTYADVYSVLKTLEDNPWRGGKDALINYCNRKFGA